MIAKPLAAIRRSHKIQVGLITGAIAAVALIVVILNVSRPERSVASYCEVYSQEKARLTLLSGPSNAYPSATFDVSVNDASEIAVSLGKLDQVAPRQIEPSVKTLQQLYQKVHDDPSQDLAVSISGETIDNNLAGWTISHCGNS